MMLEGYYGYWVVLVGTLFSKSRARIYERYCACFIHYTQTILSPVLLRCTMMLWHMGPRQPLSEVVGTHVVLACKWIITVFYT
jgi:hypothetical protein